MRKNIVRLALALTPAMLMHGHAADSRFRTYGPIEAKSSAGKSLPGRVGAAVEYTDGADFITVGKLDGSPKGPYETYKDGDNKSDSKAIWEDWSKKKGCSRLIGNSAGVATLAIGISESTPSCQEYVLKQQFDAECPASNSSGCTAVREAVMAWNTYHTDPTNPSAPIPPPVFEIGNEPNIFPYISPVAYAAYYVRWVKAIKQVEPRALIMNGGLWVWSGAPPFITKYCVELEMDCNSEAWARLFFEALVYHANNDLREDPQAYFPDILNLHWYPWVSRYGEFGDFAGSGSNEMDLIVEKNFQVLMSWVKKYKPFSRKGLVWLTEVGNINPGNDYAEIAKRMLLRLNQQTEITRWYWYKASGQDHKISSMLRSFPIPPILLNILQWWLDRQTLADKDLEAVYLVMDFLALIPPETLVNGINVFAPPSKDIEVDPMMEKILRKYDVKDLREDVLKLGDLIGLAKASPIQQGLETETSPKALTSLGIEYLGVEARMNFSEGPISNSSWPPGPGGPLLQFVPPPFNIDDFPLPTLGVPSEAIQYALKQLDVAVDQVYIQVPESIDKGKFVVQTLYQSIEGMFRSERTITEVNYGSEQPPLLNLLMF